MQTYFFGKLGLNIKFFRGFTNFFSRLLDHTGLQHKLLILIESRNIFHGKFLKNQSGRSLQDKIAKKAKKVFASFFICCIGNIF